MVRRTHRAADPARHPPEHDGVGTGDRGVSGGLQRPARAVHLDQDGRPNLGVAQALLRTDFRHRTLADTPAELWRRIGGQLRDAMREIIDPGEKWLLGGGTVLEARWKHRYTKDIDLKLRPPTGRDRYLLARQLPHFVTRMQELGAERIIDAERQLIVSFGKAVLDIFQNAPTPGSGEEEYLIDEQPETVLSNAQILYGKPRWPRNEKPGERPLRHRRGRKGRPGLTSQSPSTAYGAGKPRTSPTTGRRRRRSTRNSARD